MHVLILSDDPSAKEFEMKLATVVDKVSHFIYLKNSLISESRRNDSMVHHLISSFYAQDVLN